MSMLYNLLLFSSGSKSSHEPRGSCKSLLLRQGGGGVVVWWVRVNQCKVVLGDMEVLLWWSFHDSKISSEIEEAPRQNLLTLLKQFWSKNDKMPKYNMAILLSELLSKML